MTKLRVDQLKAIAARVADKLKKVEVSRSCWIDARDIERFNSALGLSLREDRADAERTCGGAYLMNLIGQVSSRDEREALSDAAANILLPSADEIRTAAETIDLSLDGLELDLVAMRVVEIW